PGENAFVIFFDQSYGSVNDSRVAGAQEFRGSCQKVGEIRTWDVNLGNDKTRLLASNLLAQLLRIIRQICTELIRVGPISLPVRRQVIIGVARESFGAICVSEAQ